MAVLGMHEPEQAAYGLLQCLSLGIQFLSSAGALFGARGVGLGDLIHLADGGVDLAEPSGLLIGGGRVETLPLMLFSFATSGRNDLTGAIGMIYILPGVLILIFASRHLTGQGAAMSGVRP